jgi:solute carrier family 25 protein 39/40
VLAVPTTIIYMTTYEQLRSRIVSYLDRKHPLYEHKHAASSMLAGTLGRVWAVTIVSPLELVRTKMQSQKQPLSQVWAALANTVRTEGVLGLWKGYAATLYRDVPFSGIYWPCYEFFKGQLLTEDHQFGATFISGAIAGTVASTATLPMDVIKTRRQVELGEKDIMHIKPGRAASTMSIAREIFADRGVAGLYSGLVPRILKVAPACAIMISCYEFGKRFFMQRNLDRDIDAAH